MQQDALRRVRQMQERARSVPIEAPVPQEPAHHIPAASSSPPVPQKPPASPQGEQRQARKSSGSRFGVSNTPAQASAPGKGKDFLSLLTGDNERTLILLLLVLLMNEKADTYLLLAMLYLLM